MIPQPIDQVPLFLKLSDEERELLSSRLRHLQLNTNDVIFAAGKPAEMMAVIVQGWVKLEADPVERRVALANLGAGSVIGDIDLLLNRPYSTSARAASATHLMVLYRQDLQELILARPTIGLSLSAGIGARVAYLDDYLVTQRLGAIPLLSALSEDELKALAARLEFQGYGRGDTLFESGSEATAIHIIEEGTARLIIPSQEGDSFEQVNAGEMLGQSALITGKPYNMTARAVTDVKTWVLTRADFLELIHQYPTIKLAFARSMAETLSGQDQARAVEQLRAMPLFADVETDALRDIATFLVLRHFPAGVTIYAQGTPGDALYFVESGQVRLVADAGEQSQVLDQRTSGQTFGEMALLTGRTRGESAQAADDTTAWVLYKSDYDDLIVRHPSLSLALSRALSGRLSSSGGEFIESQLTSFKLLGGLSPYELKHVGEFVKPLRFRPGETICQTGQTAQYIYLVSRGQVREIARGPNGQASILHLVDENESFGERAVVQGTFYATTMQAVGEVECLTLGKPDFDRLVGRYPALALNLARRMAAESDQAVHSRPLRPTPPRPAPVNRPAPPRSASYAGAPRMVPPRSNGNSRAPSPAQPVPVTQAPASVGLRTTQQKPWDRNGSGVLRPMPSATARSNGQAEAAQPTAPEAFTRPRPRRNRPTLLSQLSNLSMGSKVALGVTAFIAFWLLIIVPLYFVVSWLGSATGFGGAFSGDPSSKDLPANIEALPIQRAAMAQMTGKLAFKVRTATPTPLPATPVPTAQPTAKAAAKKPVVSAAKPKAQPTAQVAALAQPTEAAAAALAAPAAPLAPLPPRQWDKRLGDGGLPLLTGVGVHDAQVQSGQQFWRLTKMVYQDAGQESGNDHTIYISLVDENGVRVDDQTVLISWDESGVLEQQQLTLADQKAKGDYCNCNFNWPMYGGGYRVRVDGSLSSDEAYGMIMPMKRHVNYLLTFQRVVMP